MQHIIEMVRRLDPNAANEFRPADEATIRLLHAYARPLPGAYLRFLRTMGGSLGHLRIGNAIFSAAVVKSTMAHFGWIRRDRFLLIAPDQGPTDYGYYLDREHPASSEDCLLVRLPMIEDISDSDILPVRLNLEEFLVEACFEQFRLLQLSHHRAFDCTRVLGQEPSIDHACTTIEALGFARLIPSSTARIFDRQDGAAIVSQNPVSRSFSISLGADSENDLNKWTKELQERLLLVESTMLRLTAPD